VEAPHRFETVLIEDRGSTRLITLHRPARLNAVNRQLARDVVAALRDAAADGAAHAIVLTGAGRAFSAGADLAEARGLSVGDIDGQTARLREVGARGERATGAGEDRKSVV